ncbi:MAG: maleylpyruvate isomerase N-terminal domain-containing protein [Actinomycetota bacterium]|nr:maleylpyruvate isomerase N-terminal domain-containing protein [Actinomycetota bacterium]
MAPDDEVCAAFEAAADWYLSVLTRIPADAWDGPGLGSWTVKELAAHTARAFVTIETYLAEAPNAAEVHDPVTYFQIALADSATHAGVAERGKREAANLGDDPAASIAIIAERVRGIVATTPGDALTRSAVGGMRFSDYLMTRTVELTVHTCDICQAIGLDEQPPEVAAALTFSVLGGLAAIHPRRREVLRALTGRVSLPDGCNVLG